MESELMSLRSKIDELEQKLGGHPSIGSLSQSSNPPTSRQQIANTQKSSRRALKEEELHDFNLSEPSQEQDPFEAYGSKSQRLMGSQQLPQMPMSLDDLSSHQKSARNGFAFG
jgi:hypothetical protein